MIETSTSILSTSGFMPLPFSDMCLDFFHVQFALCFFRKALWRTITND